MDFSTFCLIQEAIQSPNIVDIYILMSMPEPADEANRFIKNEVISKSSRTILNEIDNILLRELRHIETNYMEDYMEDERMLKNREYYDQDDRKRMIEDLAGFQKRFGTPPAKLYMIINTLSNIYGSERGNRYLTAETNLRDINTKFGTHITHRDIVNMFKDNRYWELGYGGESWAKIAEFALALNQSVSNPSEFLKRLDRFVDFVHNNGAVANKFRGYHEGWLLYILDLKQHVINIRELIPYASKDVQKMFRDVNWRELTRKIPGGGAATSFEVYRALMQRYAKMFEKDKSWNSTIANTIKIGNMVKKIGYEEVVRLIKQTFPDKLLYKVYDRIFDEGEIPYLDEEEHADAAGAQDLLEQGANAIDAAYKTHPGS